MTTSATKLLCLIGDPVDHSVSPEIFTRAFEACGLDAVYLAFRVPKEGIGTALSGLRALGFLGCNVTVPHKVEVMKCLDEVRGAAVGIGAVNLVKNEGGRLIGYNTDGEGVLWALSEVNLDGKRVAVIGYGGAARAVAFAIASRHMPREIIIAGRDAEKAERLVRDLSGSAKATVMRIDELSRLDLDLIVNATPVGMSPNVEEMPIAEDALRSGMVVFDLVYSPKNTALLRAARRKGCRTISGVEMLVRQAAAGFEIWTGMPAPVEEMRRAADAALELRGRRG
ncbi:MAG: shikimate dehydrogenase [Candidatus Methanosuratus sp.]|nr:shikimate dehydrogenase [Candidatus Methanosuratincola sp.]